MTIPNALREWLTKLGYDSDSDALHLADQTVPKAHPYSRELHALLRPDGAIRARAVFDVEGVPTVVFVTPDDSALQSGDLDAIRQRIWNQNLANIVIAIDGNAAIAASVSRLKGGSQNLTIEDASESGPFSAAEIRSSEITNRLPSWFDSKVRVDRKLLDNITTAIRRLGVLNVLQEQAQLLMGQILFISYLEHRDIVSDVYRARRHVCSLHELVMAADTQGIERLVEQLKQDFNGDFLSMDEGEHPWANLSEAAYKVLAQFLSRVDLETGQGSFWNYDFSFIPVELLSGLYESFLSPTEQASEGAYYTPRHLATLAVDEAFAASPDPLTEEIFDGACGSGILLTTAYRRLIALQEARSDRPLGFSERRALLLKHIFGGDTNPMACRVTAFSLYLSLLEGLDPSDVLEAQERDGARLPSLRGSNLCSGPAADYFSDEHPFAGRRFTLIISNPPWNEPRGGERTSADVWCEAENMPFVRRQIAGAFSLKALDYLVDGGRICMILPIPQFLGPTSADYVPVFLDRVRPLRLINFGDLQQLLFPTAEQTCHVIVGTRRPLKTIGRAPVAETFDYSVPKADLSLMFGRLTLLSADRHQLQTQAVRDDPQLLVALMWGGLDDVALWTRLATRGTLRDFWTGPKGSRRWKNRKGIHFEDKSRVAMDADRLREMPFISVEALRQGVPVLHPDLLQAWPENQAQVVGLNEEILTVFQGPRVLYPDGFSRKELTIRSVYYDKPGAYKSSVGVISGPQEDESLLRFLAIYLRSSLARYFLMLRGWKMLCERNGVHLDIVESFPFFAPERAPLPADAQSALQQLDKFSRALERLPELQQASYYTQHQEEIDQAVFAYFGLGRFEQAIVKEAVEVLMPSIRPRSYRSLNTPIQHQASKENLEGYASVLVDALTGWRERMGGVGHFDVSVVATHPSRAGSVGIIRVGYLPHNMSQGSLRLEIDDRLALDTWHALQRDVLVDGSLGGELRLLPNARIWTPQAVYFVRPLRRRSWLTRTALQDAENIVRDVQAQGHSLTMEAA